MQYKHMDDIYVCVSLGLTELENLIKDLNELKDAKNKNPEVFANTWILSSTYQLDELHKQCLAKAKINLGIYE